nr:immunoglobulin heavy chain junction region [Mus musculus]MBK4197407.1 immunoglobulin heavy chain junction region [Mus musculus]MBK4197408.1 immunoglobulin heavy chain junction region [Mus musculus]
CAREGLLYPMDYW